MNPEEIEEKFFYANKSAAKYDETIEWIAPHYRELHDLLVNLAKMSCDGLKKPDNAILALDIGSGSGTEGIGLLNAMPDLNLVGLDISPPMQEVFSDVAERNGIKPDRYVLVTGDVMDPNIGIRLTQTALEKFGDKQFNLVISAFTLHHLKSEQKELVFKLVHELLPSGGVFLLGDLFNYATESNWLSDIIYSWETEWISNNFKREISKLRTPDLISEMKKLEVKWLNHYANDNHLNSISEQVAQLKSVGFSEIGNPMRFWQVGLIWSRK